MSPFYYFAMVLIASVVLYFLIFYFDGQAHVVAGQTHVVHNLDKTIINTILVSIYTAQYAQEESTCECIICLDEFEDNDRLGTLSICYHTFHLDCIEVWLRKNPNCPLCRSNCSLNLSMIIDVTQRSLSTPQ
ncbi:putative transcription factor C2H2 family [Medicago truncatula]|uniref:RING-type E3 ubiquitin transferase n=1 Tax=Medicago truncatula TaxID=3880 RepID=A0A396ITU8_MEDTR|nr:putative transcription factor C2H2 family [Medicago truncatula]